MSSLWRIGVLGAPSHLSPLTVLGDGMLDRVPGERYFPALNARLLRLSNRRRRILRCCHCRAVSARLW